MKLTPDWMEALPLQQQAVLLLALRGPDGFQKHHSCKPILYRYRACILKAAHLGRMLRFDEDCESLMSLSHFYNKAHWEQLLKAFRETEDELPLHFYTHLMHGAQILAYKHPHYLVKNRWWSFYVQCCDYLHTPVETEEQMDQRLSDFGRPLEKVLP